MTVLGHAIDRAIAARGLPGVEAGTVLVADRLDDAAFATLLARSAAHRTTGLLARAVADGALPATDEQRSAAFDAHATEMRQALLVEAELVEVVARLGHRDLEITVLKGVATAHLDHLEPADRSFQDVDLLVPPAHLSEVVELLLAAGYRRDLPSRTHGWDASFAKDITLTGQSGIEVDVHRTLVPGALGFTIDLAELRADAELFPLGRHQLRALGPERRALHAAYALTVGEAAPRLAAARDLALVLRRPTLDDGRMIDLAARWRATPLLAEAVLLVAAQLGRPTVPASLVAWAETAERGRWHRAVRRTYRSAGGTNSTTLLGGVLGLSRWGARAAYLRGLALPSADYRRARRAAGRPPEARTALRELTHRDPPR
jgi:hypothetical protein